MFKASRKEKADVEEVFFGGHSFQVIQSFLLLDIDAVRAYL